MPHGAPPLTPLGRQLRRVLANISYYPPSRPRALPNGNNARRLLHSSAGGEAAEDTAVAFSPSLQPQQESNAPKEDTLTNKHFHKLSARSVRKGARINHVNHALKVTGNAELVYTPMQGSSAKPDRSYINPRLSSQEQRAKAGRSSVSPRDHRNVSLQKILASYVLWLDGHGQSLEADPHSTFSLLSMEAEYLHFKGYNLDDVKAWAEIVSEKDPLIAAEKLGDRVERLGTSSTPLFICMNLLHRPYITARALRALLDVVPDVFAQRALTMSKPGLDDAPRFLAVIRLLRHAREVWPGALPAITEFALSRHRTRVLTEDQVPHVTHSLNSLMGLISLPTAENPFQDSLYQEAAIIPILSFMSEHQPPLQIDRRGYRAVIRIQLAQRKTDDDQQWAQLKSLSWPPWKADRTAMDSEVTAESHGRSRAGKTLQRMREAGYRPLHWERIAQIYTGWDLDGTPTVQKRTRHDKPSPLHGIEKDDLQDNTWAARIQCTRTVQEAWACYLAWEDRDLPPNQEVFQAIADKLREEERRPSVESRDSSQQETWPLFPGDGREISPPPPSTHLHTYTRSIPPTVEDFYHHIRSKGVFFEGHCLAMFIRHARDLQAGLHYLRGHAPRYPEIQGILTLDPSHDLNKLPGSIYVAAISLFSRFGHVSPHNTGLGRAHLTSERTRPLLKGYALDTRVGIVRAIELLRLRPEFSPICWNIVYQGMTREQNFERLATIFTARPEEHDMAAEIQTHPDHQRYDGAMNAYRLARRVLALQHEKCVDLDSTGFMAVCRVVENMALSHWSIISEAEAFQAEKAVGRDGTMGKHFGRLVRNAREFVPKTDDAIPHAALVLKREFSKLTGTPCDETSRNLILPSSSSSNDDQVKSPQLLAIPFPALLHAYIRALGFLGDHDGLLNLVLWMREHHQQLKERQDLDRRGADMMRKALFALRASLQRSWIPEEIMASDGFDASDQTHVTKFLSRLRRPAEKELVERVREVVDEVDVWQGWPSEEEVVGYCSHERFERFKY